jgi:hypothetical protein
MRGIDVLHLDQHTLDRHLPRRVGCPRDQNRNAALAFS